MRDKKYRHVPGGRTLDTCDHGLSRNLLRVKTFYELGWKVKVMIKKKQEKTSRLSLSAHVRVHGEVCNRKRTAGGVEVDPRRERSKK